MNKQLIQTKFYGKWFSLIMVSFKVYSKLNSPSLKHSRRTMEREEPEKTFSLKIFQVQGKTHILLHITIWQKHVQRSLIVCRLSPYRINLKNHLQTDYLTALMYI